MKQLTHCSGCNSNINEDICEQYNVCPIRYQQSSYGYAFYTKDFYIECSIYFRNIKLRDSKTLKLTKKVILELPYFDIDFSKLEEYNERWNKLMVFI